MNENLLNKANKIFEYKENAKRALHHTYDTYPNSDLNNRINRLLPFIDNKTKRIIMEKLEYYIDEEIKNKEQEFKKL